MRTARRKKPAKTVKVTTIDPENHLCAPSDATIDVYPMEGNLEVIRFAMEAAKILKEAREAGEDVGQLANALNVEMTVLYIGGWAKWRIFESKEAGEVTTEDLVLVLGEDRKDAQIVLQEHTWQLGKAGALTFSREAAAQLLRMETAFAGAVNTYCSDSDNFKNAPPGDAKTRKALAN